MDPVIDPETKREVRKMRRTTAIAAALVILLSGGLIWGALYLEDVKKGVHTEVVGEGADQKFVVRMQTRQQASTVVIHCSEDQYEEAFAKFRDHLKVDEPPFDIPGGPMVIALAHADLPENLQKVKRTAVEILKRHSPRRIVLVAHSECLIYDSIGAWQNRLNEVRERQLADLEQAVRVMREWFPNASIEAYYALKEGEELHFEQISFPPDERRERFPDDPPSAN